MNPNSCNWDQSKINSNLVLLPTQKAAREKNVGATRLTQSIDLEG